MQEIPDTGGGLSGFIAWLLWRVYVYFPFEGTWDWLLLIIFLAVLARCIMIPVWSRMMKSAGRSNEDRILLLTFPFLGDLLWPWLVIGLFNTAAGRTFLEGRSGQPLEVAGSLYWFSLAYHVAAFFVAVGLINLSYFALQSGAGALMQFVNDVGGLLCLNALFAGLGHGLYWYWSVASLAVFCVFSITALLTGAIGALLEHLYSIKY